MEQVQFTLLLYLLGLHDKGKKTDIYYIYDMIEEIQIYT